MSYLYYLTCIDCGIRLDLGKIACFDEGGNPKPWFLSGWLDQTDRHRVFGGELGEIIQRFLILHRGHELRVLPDAFLDRADPERNLSVVDTAADVMEQKVVPEPDPQQDADIIHVDVMGRIRSRFRDDRS